MKHRLAVRLAHTATVHLMLLLGLSLGLPQGVAVICAGPDGHLAVEFAAGPQPAGDGCGCAEECGPCRDVQVGHDGALHSQGPVSPHRDAAAVAFTGPSPALGALVSLPSRPRFGDHPGWPAAPPPTERSVVLLI